MTTAVKELLEILDLEILEHNLFRGHNPYTGWKRVFGGQVIAQALMAAQRTVDPSRPVHSLHGYFMLGGDPKIPIIYEVDRIRDGGSFTTRRVVAIQHGHAIFSMSASFQREEIGLDYQSTMPIQPDPRSIVHDRETNKQLLEKVPENVRDYWQRERPIEMLPTSLDHYLSDKKLVAEQYTWLRATGKIPDDRLIQSAVLAYASDMTLLDTSLYPHGKKVFDNDLQVASLDHSMWFHRPVDLNDWLLFAQDSPSSSGSRGLARGSLYTQSGELIASTAQEGLIRLKDPKRSK
jgi:acyl-CoA thioesterase-2